MALPANWTTQVPSEKSIAEIMVLLKRFGAREVRLELAEKTGETLAISFALDHPKHGFMPFRLPADGEAVQRVIQREFNKHTIGQRAHMTRRYLTAEHGQNVAWRICKDWLRAQLSLIELEMVSLEAVMLPYLITRGGKPLFQSLQEGGFQALLPAPKEDR